MSSASMPQATINSTTTARADIKIKFDGKGGNFKTDGGINVLDAVDKAACNDLFDQMESYGIFVVRNGELESWLKPLKISANHSPEWLIETFEKLGEDPALPTYIKPSAGDVWDFVKSIKDWFNNVDRKGIPE